MEGIAKQGGAGKKRDDNIIQVSSKRNSNFYVYLAKKILAENHPDIELHALGNAVSTAVIAAENLARYLSFKALHHLQKQLCHLCEHPNPYQCHGERQ